MSVPSLRRRLLVGLGGVLFVSLAFYGAWSVFTLREMGESLILGRLEDDAESLVALLSFDEEGHPRIPQAAMSRIFHRAYSGHYFRLIAPGGEIVSRSLWGHPLPGETIAPGQVRVFQETGPLGQRLMVRLAGYRKGGHDFTLALAEDVSAMEERLDRRIWQTVGWSIAVLWVVWFVQAQVVRRGLAPLLRARDQLREMEAGRRDRLDEEAPAEILPLVQEVNRLVDHLENRVQRSREGLGNLAHALKGPLSLLAQLIERKEIRAHPELHTQCQEALARLRNRVDRELKRVRLAGEGTTRAMFLPEEELSVLIDLLRRIHRREGLEVVTMIPTGIRYRIDREDALEILGNLLDNAFKWARERVWVRIEEADHLLLEVEDDGPGIPPQHRTLLLNRGARLDEQREGQGLGLAIVREAVAQYRGTLSLESGAAGGLRVRVDLPGAVCLSPAPLAGGGGASD